ncbi:cytochrome c biogenesis protein ResB [Desulfuromonas acetoxidans]|uniref:ResB-like n=1 Tax=Desulfuromonas acetoxidans (strain DSM 684 / 11070) TaxID=281689 RepID=Q1JX86_DESA6|nr:cytochrome c biogenesis protein ResB [Desulfuromonas acetoxidans]EAT14906.1 ResB-like [Desulfuromonas acetoxidans DSM 684]MBF0645563.1 cytochrome c biogenesis protein ResB [Desulfuromonas acetoxidans]NVD23365.1 cytochrome c biogenesis protein ResB [Desulfuromonas acetoxidans]NVE15394.1 cytochrome c biogenesis protein ResB [Desulfuromonas acetoxidans]
MSVKQRGFFGRLWDFFCSLKLTIFILIALAITSIIGTVIQQNLSRQEYLRVFSEDTYRVLDSLQFFDMYHSWWFIGLLLLFCVNLTCCSIKRLPRVWRLVHNPSVTPSEQMLKAFSNVDEKLVKGDLPTLLDRMKAFVGAEFATAQVNEKDGSTYLYAEKAKYARFGVYVTHLSILIIFLGAIIGNLYGYKAFVNIPEGGESDRVWMRNGQTSIPLGFSVRCEDFSVEFYGNSQRPKEYESILTVIDQGETVIENRHIEVNDPLSYKGITFYQSSYGPAGDEVISIKVKVRGEDKVDAFSLHRGQLVELPSGDRLRIADFTPMFRNFGPAARLEVLPKEGEARVVTLFKNFPKFDEERGGDYIFTLVDFDQLYYTGLQVTKDPGVWVVWVGCTLMIVGCLVAFFISHRRMWVVLTPQDNGKIGVRLVGSAHRNQPAFELYFDELKKKFRDALSA